MKVAAYHPTEETKDRVLRSRTYRELRKMMKELNQEYDWESKLEEILELDESLYPDYIDELPGAELKICGVTYKIHGVVHDERELKVSNKVKNFVRARCHENHRPKKGIDYLCESYVGKTFDLDNRMNDHSRFLLSWIGLGVYNILAHYKNRLRNIPAVKRVKFLSKRNDETANSVRLKKRIIRAVGKNLAKAMEDPVYLAKARELSHSLIRAPPIEFDTDFDVWRYNKLLEYQAIKKSKYMAKYMKEFTGRKELECLHAVVGLGHEPHIKVFLENLDYPAKLLLLNIYPDQ